MPILRVSDRAELHWIRSGAVAGTPVVLIGGGPGLPEYLGPLAAMIDDLAPVHRYDQRGAGASAWSGEQLWSLHVRDLGELLDAWGVPDATLIGHSAGADLTCRFALAHPDRVRSVMLLAGPFVGEWRDAYRAERLRRMTPAQVSRWEELSSQSDRDDAEEIELLELSWVSDFADPTLAPTLAADAARTRRPVSWSMNQALGSDSAAHPLDPARLRETLPIRTLVVGGARDPRPASALIAFADAIGRPRTIIRDAGHEPWSEQPAATARIIRSFVSHRD